MTAVIVRSLGLQDYPSCWQAMKAFTDQRHEETLDELWIVEHPPVFTQGQNGKPEHILNAGEIPVIQADRGGQVTYHGPGQLMLYTLIDVRRLKFNVRQLVSALENAVISLLAAHEIKANAKCDAPGVYVDDQKICSVGLRIRRGCSYHGLALNVDMDLEPFSRINPCGYAALKMTQLVDLAGPQKTADIAAQLVEYLIAILGYTSRLDKME
jgi:lipoyl(octanoyl) transferase